MIEPRHLGAGFSSGDDGLRNLAPLLFAELAPASADPPFGTRLGKAMRAVSQDPTAAALLGIDVDRVIAATFFIGADGVTKAKTLGPVLKDRLRDQLALAGAK